MDATVWITAASALIGALIGAGAVLLAQALEASRRTRAGREQELKLAVEEVLVRAQSVDLRARDSLVLAANAGSIVGLISRVVGHSAPLDLSDVLERLAAEATSLYQAASRVWLMGDAQTVALANGVVIAAAKLADAHSQPVGGRLSNLATIAVSGQYAASPQRIAAARQELARSRGALANHARQLLNLPKADLFDLAPSRD